MCIGDFVFELEGKGHVCVEVCRMIKESGEMDSGIGGNVGMVGDIVRGWSRRVRRERGMYLGLKLSIDGRGR